MRECSLHFDFVNAEGKLDLNKADTLMEMPFTIFNTVTSVITNRKPYTQAANAR